MVDWRKHEKGSNNMGLILTLVLVIFFACAGASTNATVQHTYATMRCPTCGAKALIRGSSWECTECGDSGKMR